MPTLDEMRVLLRKGELNKLLEKKKIVMTPRIRLKLLMVKTHTVDFMKGEDLTEELYGYVKENKKIKAVKYIKDKTKKAIHECKKFADKLWGEYYKDEIDKEVVKEMKKSEHRWKMLEELKLAKV